METHKYQYGSDPSHIVELTENQARATNEALFFPNGEAEKKPGHTVLGGTLSLPDGVTVEDLNSAADILNAYIAANGGSIPCTQEYLEENPILKRI